MADEATQEVEETSAVEETTADSQPVEQTQESEQPSTDEKPAEPASTDDKKPSETQDVKPEPKPLSRRSAAYRIQQLTRENKQLREQQKPAQQNEWDEEPATDDPQQSVAELVAKEVERRLNPVINESSKAADNGEINELFSGDRASERSKYEPKIREMWNDPKAPYKDVAADDLYKIAKFDELQASIPAIQQKAIEDYKQAEIEARNSSAGGNSNNNRTGKGGKSINDLPDDEFLKRNERIKAGLPVD